MPGPQPGKPFDGHAGGPAGPRAPAPRRVRPAAPQSKIHPPSSQREHSRSVRRLCLPEAAHTPGPRSPRMPRAALGDPSQPSLMIFKATAADHLNPIPPGVAHAPLEDTEKPSQEKPPQRPPEEDLRRAPRQSRRTRPTASAARLQRATRGVRGVVPPEEHCEPPARGPKPRA